jgi:hypothetical protein
VSVGSRTAAATVTALPETRTTGQRLWMLIPEHLLRERT